MFQELTTIPEGAAIKHLGVKVTQDLDGASCLKVSKAAYLFYFFIYLVFIECSTDGCQG